jgi:predicted ATPase/DNA-binding SARP family transcriptional activator
VALKIFLLGQFKLRAGERLLELPSRGAQSLLAYLALNAGVNQRREKLAGLLWPDAAESNARSYLRQALWRIRKALADGGLDWQAYLQVSDIALIFDDQADYWLDVAVLLAPGEARSPGDLMAAVGLYQGELLPGFYDEWLLLERDRVQAGYHHKMSLLLDGLIQAGRWTDALRWAEEWIRLGNSPEPAFRALMRAYAATGDRAMVGNTFQRCVEALDRELGVEPSAGTVELYEQLCRAERDGRPERVTLRSGLTTRQPAFLDDAHERAAEQPIFVGREAELAELDGHLSQVLDGQGRVVFVTGEAGSGKTALIEAFARRAQDAHPDLVVAGGNCNAHTGIGDPYLPFREILQLITGDVESRWAAGSISGDHARSLWQTMPLTAQAILEAGPGLIDTFIPGRALVERVSLCVPAGTGWLTYLDGYVGQRAAMAPAPGPQQSDLFGQYSRVLHQLAGQVPLLLVLDDLQWADLGSISLLFHLGRHLAGRRILIAGAFRPEEVAMGRDGDRHPLLPVVNELQRLSGDVIVDVDHADSRQFVTALLDSEPNQLGPSFRQMLFQQTGGQPLFTVELLRGMQERGDLLHNEGGQWVEGQALDWEKMPARVEAVIAERIERLARPLQDALRVASVEGDEFTAGVVARVLGVDEGEMLHNLSRELDRRHRLVGSQSILRLDGRSLSRYRFRHTLFQKYLYRNLDAVERAHLHEQVGLALEELLGEGQEITAVAAQLARHFQEAGIAHKAVHYLHRAGEEAFRLSAYQEAVGHLNRALTLLMSLPDSPARAEQELDLQLALGMAHMRKLPSPEWRTGFNRARELCLRAGKTDQLALIMGELAVVHFVRAEHEQARALATEAFGLARQSGDPLLAALGSWYLAFVFFYIGEFEACRSHLSPLLDLYDPRQHHFQFLAMRGADAGMSALGYEACALWCLGWPEQAERRSRQALALIGEFDHPFSVAEVLCFAGCMYHSLRGDAEAVEKYAAEMLRLTNKQGFDSWLATATWFQAEALILCDQTALGIAHARESMADSERIRERLNYGQALGALARAYDQAGRPDEALATIEKALDLTIKTGAHFLEAEWRRLQARFLRQLGDSAAAEASLGQALEVARRQKAKMWELRAAVDLAGLWREQGRPDQARSLLAGIYDWFTEGFDTADLRAARELLAALSAVGLA